MLILITANLKCLRLIRQDRLLLFFRHQLLCQRLLKVGKTVGIRIPDNKIALELVRKFGGPILTTTIEFEDEDYAINPELIAERYDGEVQCLLDGGDGGLIPSTVVDSLQ